MDEAGLGQEARVIQRKSQYKDQVKQVQLSWRQSVFYLLQEDGSGMKYDRERHRKTGDIILINEAR